MWRTTTSPGTFTMEKKDPVRPTSHFGLVFRFQGVMIPQTTSGIIITTHTHARKRKRRRLIFLGDRVPSRERLLLLLSLSILIIIINRHLFISFRDPLTSRDQIELFSNNTPGPANLIPTTSYLSNYFPFPSSHQHIPATLRLLSPSALSFLTTASSAQSGLL